MKLYKDIEHDLFYTENQLKEEFKKVQLENPEEYSDITFEQWINNCLWQQGGTLQYCGKFGYK